MDVVRHEAVGGNLEVGLLAASVAEVEVKEVVAVFEEDLLAAITPLGDVMGYAFSGDSGDLCH